MYSVILTEFGIVVFKDEKLEKAFPFKDSVRDYLSVKKKESRLNELVDYLSPLQRGVTVSDESLMTLLKKSSIDAQMMEEIELEKIQATKPQIIVDSGFAESMPDALSKLREFAMGLSSSKVTEVSESPDLHIIQAINSLDEIDKIANGLSSRLREWYGLHFPELDNIIDSINGYAQIVLAGKRESLTKKVYEDAGFPDSKAEMISLLASKSRGGDISDVNLSIVQSIAKQILDFHDLRKKLEDHVESEMQTIAPNISAILGAAVGARILGRAGSLRKLASMPASTVQVIGAEKALFRSLKTGAQPPKHGLLFQHAMVHAAPRWQRGKIARAIAAKAVIAARVDVYGEGINNTLLEKLNVRVNEISKKYENPTESETRKPESFRREGGDFRRREGTDSRRESGGSRRESGGSRRRESTDSRGVDFRRRESGGSREGGESRRRDSTDSRGGDFRRRESGGSREGGESRRRESTDSRGGDFRRRESGGSREGGESRRRDSTDSRGGDFRRRESGGSREGRESKRESGGSRESKRESGGSRESKRESGGSREPKRESGGSRESKRESREPKRENKNYRERTDSKVNKNKKRTKFERR
jgi:nucleolar protein 56